MGWEESHTKQLEASFSFQQGILTFDFNFRRLTKWYWLDTHQWDVCSFITIIPASLNSTISHDPREQSQLLYFSLEESIRQLDGEIDIETSQTPIFLAVLCLAAKDLSETVTVLEQRTLYAAYILPKTSFILLAHETGSRMTSILNTPLICPFYHMQKIPFK